MPSLDTGKDIVVSWIRESFPTNSEILDVGACDGKWRQLLPEYDNIDAVEIFEPSARYIEGMYRNVFNVDILDFKYQHYDLIIFGDVIEHLTIENAQKVLRYAKRRCNDMIVAVPFLYPQGEIYGNPYEVHIQPDLTAEIFAQRYPGFDVLYDTGQRYCFYHKGGRNEQRKRI